MNEQIEEQIKNKLAEVGITKEYTFANDQLAQMFLHSISADNVKSVELINDNISINYEHGNIWNLFNLF